MELKKINTSELRYDPLDPDFVTDLQMMPEFKPNLWPSKELDRKMVYTYIVLMYDKDCNLNHFFPNYWHRKRIACETAGWNIVKGRFPEIVEKMLFGDLSVVNRMAVRYACLFNEPDYLALVSYYEMFIQETFLSLKEQDSDSKKKISNNIHFFNTQIKSLTKEIFGGEEAMGFRKALYKTAISDLLDLRPELIALTMQDEKQPTDTFYGNGEIVEQ